MRLAGIEKLGFYPTPPKTLARIAHYLDAQRNGVTRVLDPCAGYGEAVKYVGDTLKRNGATVSTYGVELSDVRGSKFHENLDHAINGDFNHVTLTPRTMSILYLNPPYDLEAATDSESGKKRQRVEYTFLKNSLPKLVYGGVLVYIVPLHIIQTKIYINYITNHLENIRIYRLPDDEFERFKQVVLFAQRKDIKEDRDNEEIPEYSNENLPPELPDSPEHIYVVPATRNNSFQFRLSVLDDEELIQHAQMHGAHTTRQWAQLNEAQDHSEFRPVIKLKVGHISNLITSGQTGVVHLGDSLAVGRTFKQVNKVKTLTDEDGNKTGEVTRDHFVTSVTTMDREGQLKSVSPTNGMGAFLEENGELISQLVAKKYKPLYQEPTEDEWRKLMPLMKSKRLAGRKNTGLFLAQKHIAVAIKRAIDKMGWVTLVGEMGTGKTATSIASAELLNQWPVAVLAPTHILDKWAAEVSLVIPDAKGFVIQDLADLIKFHKEWEPGKKWFAVMSKETAKLGPGWIPAYDRAKIHDGRRLRYGHRLPNGERYVVDLEIVRCPKCGALQRTTEGFYVVTPECYKDLPASIKDKLVVMSSDNRFNCLAPAPRRVGDPHDNTTVKEIVKDKDGEIIRCNEPLWRTENKAERNILGYFKDADGNWLPPEDLEKPEFDNYYARKEKARRWPLAEYIKDVMPHQWFKLLIADESHEYKAKGSSQAMAYHALRDASAAVINLTGTLFNGKSTSLFWSLYRNSKNIRRLYNFNSETAWAEMYGRLERTTMIGDTQEEDAAYSLKGKRRNTAKEIPGISPAIFGELLESTIFLKKSDINIKLPPYQEEIIRVDMGQAQAEQYHFMYDTLYEQFMTWIKSRDKVAMKAANRLLSTWLQRAMGRHDTGFRHEMVVWKAIPGKQPNAHRPFEVRSLPEFGMDADHYFPLNEDPDYSDDDPEESEEYTKWEDLIDDVPMFLPRIVRKDYILPKEQKAMEIIKREVRLGNKVILYVNQTGTKDIQDRLNAILKAANVRPQILPKTIAAKNRAKWIEKNERNIDVLICNPEAVKTGLDLVQFNRIIYYETTYKLDTLQQSMARIYRIGQNRDTKVYFLIYRDTMEEAFLPMISEKIKAAALLYGDNPDSAIVGEDSSASIQEEFLKRLQAGEIMNSEGLDSILTPLIEIENKEEDDDWDELATPEVEPEEDVPDSWTTTMGEEEEGEETERQSWEEFIKEQQSRKTRAKVKGKAVVEAQMLLF